MEFSNIEHHSTSMLEGKNVLVISSGGYSQRFVWNVYPEFGLKIILVDYDSSCYGSPRASEFIQYDFKDHSNDEQHAINIISILQEKKFKIDGCVTFWDDCGPLAPIICEHLGLHGSGKKAAKTAKSKSYLHNILRSRSQDSKDTYQYSAKCYPINDISDIDNAINYVGLPAVLKPEHGVRSVAIKLIENTTECKDIYQSMKLIKGNVHPLLKLGYYGDRFMLMEFISGTKHNINIALFQGEMILALVSDGGPTRHGHFTETTITMPTCLTPSQEEQMRKAAYECCTGIGLRDGVFIVEMKMTLQGPKLIEINGRMAGYYSRDWIRYCYGFDLLFISFLICVGIRPECINTSPKCRIIGTMCFPSVHKKQFENKKTLEVIRDLHKRGIIYFIQLAESMDDCHDAGYEVPFCNIAVDGSNLTEAKHKLLRVCISLEITTANYDLNHFLSDFKEH